MKSLLKSNQKKWRKSLFLPHHLLLSFSKTSPTSKPPNALQRIRISTPQALNSSLLPSKPRGHPRHFVTVLDLPLPLPLLAPKPKPSPSSKPSSSSNLGLLAKNNLRKNNRSSHCPNLSPFGSISSFRTLSLAVVCSPSMAAMIVMLFEWTVPGEAQKE